MRDTIESVRLNTVALSQLVLLPDGPNAETAATLTAMRDVLQLATAEPRGVAACFNRLAQASDNRVIVLLESGAIVGPRWLDHLVAALYADPRNGIAGPSTNLSWNEQCAFPRATDRLDDVARTAADAERRFGDTVRTLEPLHSLADFCYVVRREVIDAIGLADEGYGLGPCWEMDYNIRAARAGWRGVWACGSYVYRPTFTDRRANDERRLFEASKHRYQGKFCGARLRGEKTDYRPHCRGDACPNFALALKAFESQDYPAKELIVVDDGTDAVGDMVEKISTARYVRLSARATIGAKRNRACAEARGAVIAHWDDDDWYAPRRLHCQVAPLLAGKADLTGLENSFLFELPAGRFWGTHPDLHERMFVGDVHGGTLVYWKRLIAEGLRYPLTNIAEDAAFIQAAVRRGKRLLRVRNDGLFVYVRHGGNAWRFEPGRFLDPNGWQTTSSPLEFSPADITAWQQAAAAVRAEAAV